MLKNKDIDNIIVKSIINNMKVSTYGNNTEKTGEVKLKIDLSNNLENKNTEILNFSVLYNFRVIPQLCWGPRKTYSFAQSNKNPTQT